MSYSTRRIGMPVVVRELVGKDLAATGKSPEPEEAAKQHVAAAVDALLAAFPPSQAVEVVVAGSQSGNEEHATGELSVTVRPLLGFVS